MFFPWGGLSWPRTACPAWPTGRFPAASSQLDARKPLLNSPLPPAGFRSSQSDWGLKVLPLSFPNLDDPPLSYPADSYSPLFAQASLCTQSRPWDSQEEIPLLIQCASYVPMSSRSPPRAVGAQGHCLFRYRCHLTECWSPRLNLCGCSRALNHRTKSTGFGITEAGTELLLPSPGPPPPPPPSHYVMVFDQWRPFTPWDSVASSVKCRQLGSREIR